MSNNKKVKITLLLDGETLTILRAIAEKKLGSNSVSQAVRFMAKEYGTATKKE